MAGIAWVNGKLLPPDEPAISPLDGGFMYGEGLFETMRAYNGRVFRLRQHLERLIVSADDLSFTPPNAEKLTLAVEKALGEGGLDDAIVRLTVTPGVAGSPTPTVVVRVRPLALPPPQLYDSGCLAVSVAAAHTADNPLRRIKSLNYLDKLLAQRAAARRDAHEAILVDPDGCVIEGAMRNIFAVFSGELVTPPLSRALLPGITRATILKIAEEEGIPAHERDIPLTELYAADEAFLTSSIAEIIPIASVDGNSLKTEAPGPLTTSITKLYRALTVL